MSRVSWSLAVDQSWQQPSKATWSLQYHASQTSMYRVTTTMHYEQEKGASRTAQRNKTAARPTNQPKSQTNQQSNKQPNVFPCMQASFPPSPSPGVRVVFVAPSKTRKRKKKKEKRKHRIEGLRSEVLCRVCCLAWCAAHPFPVGGEPGAMSISIGIRSSAPFHGIKLSLSHLVDDRATALSV
jgi:hypothetical protein